MMAAAILISAAITVGTPRTAICANNSVFMVNAEEQMAVDQVGVEHAGYTVTTRNGPVQINDSDIFAKWKKGRWLKTEQGSHVLRRHDRLGFHYALFDADGDQEKPVVIVGGPGLKGNSSDYALLDRIFVMPDGTAEKDPRCARILHYGWDNLLGK